MLAPWQQRLCRSASSTASTSIHHQFRQILLHSKHQADIIALHFMKNCAGIGCHRKLKHSSALYWLDCYLQKCILRNTLLMKYGVLKKHYSEIWCITKSTTVKYGVLQKAGIRSSPAESEGWVVIANGDCNLKHSGQSKCMLHLNHQNRHYFHGCVHNSCILIL